MDEVERSRMPEPRAMHGAIAEAEIQFVQKRLVLGIILDDK
jgi:hypothetical protein